MDRLSRRLTQGIRPRHSVRDEWVFAATLALGWIPIALQGGEMRSASYTLRHPTVDAAGGVSTSGHYFLVSSSGALGDRPQTADRRVTDRQGYAGSLNDPPTTGADTVRSPGGQPLKFRVATLLANDRDPEADRLALRRFDSQGAAGGRVSLDNGWLLYEPPSPFPGSDTFTYAVEDAAGNVATSLVTVLLVGSGSSPSQNLVAITILPDGHRRITFAGIARRMYAIEWTDALPATHWTLLARVQADVRGIIEWVDAEDPAPPERYYRTVAE